MAETFSAQVGAQITTVERRLVAVFKNGAAKLIDEAQKPRAKGGRMPVVTGFLRNSGQASTEGMPEGETSGPRGESVEYDSDDTLLVIGNLQAGDTLFFGWTAVYARSMEAKYGFKRGAADKWQEIIDNEAAKARELIR